MRTAEQVVAELRACGELWESEPGLVGLRGDALHLYERIAQLVRVAAESAADDGATLGEACERWRPPAAVALSTLARARYFESFPQWLTLAAHLREDAASLERVARAADPAREACGACAPAGAALPPAVCYHVYAALAGRALATTTYVSAEGTCWRHEGDQLRPLARGWAFTMREAVCIGDADAVAAFRARGIERARSLAATLALDARLEEATDPFFRPTARGRELLQRLKGLKQELRLPVGDASVAAASFNLHERFFGEAFDIRLADGSPAASGCVAFGIERWLLAFLAAHGTAAHDWPAIPSVLPTEVAA
jgi:seryl-tRNA synthetase